jgi:hypothetical protein
VKTIDDFVKYKVVVRVQNNFEKDKFLDMCKDAGLEIDLKNPGSCQSYLYTWKDEKVVKQIMWIPIGHSVLHASEFIG